MYKSSIGYGLLAVIAIIFVFFIVINMYIFSRRNAVYFNKRNWSMKNIESDKNCS